MKRQKDDEAFRNEGSDMESKRCAVFEHLLSNEVATNSKSQGLVAYPMHIVLFNSFMDSVAVE